MTPIQKYIHKATVPSLQKALDIMDACPFTEADIEHAVQLAMLFSEGNNVKAVLSGLAAVGLGAYKEHVTKKFLTEKTK